MKWEKWVNASKRWWKILYVTIWAYTHYTFTEAICRTMRAVIAWHNESTEASKINISSKFFSKLSMKIDTSNPYSECVSVYSCTLSVYGTLPQRHVHCFAVSIHFRSHTQILHIQLKMNWRRKKCNILHFFSVIFSGQIQDERALLMCALGMWKIS